MKKFLRKTKSRLRAATPLFPKLGSRNREGLGGVSSARDAGQRAGMSPYLVVAQMRQRSRGQELALFLPGAQHLQHPAHLPAREAPVPSEDGEEILSEVPSDRWDRRRRGCCCRCCFLGAGRNEDAKGQSRDGGQERPSHEGRHREGKAKERSGETNQPKKCAVSLGRE